MPEIKPVFVETIPNELEEGKLYIALKYKTVTHKCACGCGVEINTPLHPTGWAVTYDGLGISLWPSVGNWSEKCQSHYWIEKNQIYWARPWTGKDVVKGRKKRLNEIQEYHRKSAAAQKKNLLKKLFWWLRSRLVQRQ